MAVPKEVMEKLQAAGQEHIVEDWDKVSQEEKDQLLFDLSRIDFQRVDKIFKSSFAAAEEAEAPPAPVPNVQQKKDVSPAQHAQWRSTGLKLICEGKAGILLLAGGQGTRLGSALPKGCYNIGLPSAKSLFQIQAERILKLQQLAAQEFGSSKPLRWYFMCSEMTDANTKKHFEENSYFGLDPSQIFWFNQGFLPAMTYEGKVIMTTPGLISKAPDGNGGVYAALESSGALADMEQHGVEALDCYAVDNVLARLGDPVFLGYCTDIKAECGARVVAKAYPEEKVGVFAKRGEQVQVVEYSELDPEEAKAMDPSTGILKYNWSNIAMHFFSVPWLKEVSRVLGEEAKYHIAKKSIPHKSGEKIAGVKLELFIFDTFPKAKAVALMEVLRDEEFSPLKNAPGNPKDSPETACASVLTLHKGWVVAAGGKVEGDGVEVSPLVSYAGEGLEGIVKDKTFKNAYEEALQKTA